MSDANLEKVWEGNHQAGCVSVCRGLKDSNIPYLVRQAIMEISARDDLPIQEVHGDWNQKDWFPQDATVEIWSGDQKGWSFTIEMSLKENRINFRTESQGNEPTRIFVMPEDETLAREIVREIVEGAPLE